MWGVRMQARFIWLGIGPSRGRALTCAAEKERKLSLFHNDPIIVQIHSRCSLSYDRSVASSKVRSPQGAIECFLFQFLVPSLFLRSRYSSVGIATRYGLEGPGIESRWGEIFHTYPGRLRGPPSPLYNGYRVFSGGKGGRSVMLTTHPLLVPRLRKSWAIPPLTLWVPLGLLRASPLPSLFLKVI
jgi:hypothetical protein